MSRSATKRARVEEGAEEDEDMDVWLSEGLRSLFAGRTYVKEKELTRDAMLAYCKSTGLLKQVKLLQVKVTNLAGDAFDVQLEQGNQVKELKRAIQHTQGISYFSQQIFMLAKAGDTKAVSERPMGDNELIEDCASVSLCVDIQEGAKEFSVVVLIWCH